MTARFFAVFCEKKTVQDKSTGRNHSVHHELIRYTSVINDAYHAEMAGEGVPLVASRPGKAALQPKGALDATVAKGAVMEEIRMQVSAEHRTRIRLWKSADPAVCARLELGHRVGVLEKMTELASRFTVDELAAAPSAFYTEENAYEPLRHAREARGDSAGLNVPLNFYPAQHSAWITAGPSSAPGEPTMLALALERGHGAAERATES